jgi:hypothetical protein
MTTLTENTSLTQPIRIAQYVLAIIKQSSQFVLNNRSPLDDKNTCYISMIKFLFSLYSTILQNTMSWAFGNKTVFQEMQIFS